jgi:hypothetical protein
VIEIRLARWVPVVMLATAGLVGGGALMANQPPGNWGGGGGPPPPQGPPGGYPPGPPQGPPPGPPGAYPGGQYPPLDPPPEQPPYQGRPQRGSNTNFCVDIDCCDVADVCSGCDFDCSGCDCSGFDCGGCDCSPNAPSGPIAVAQRCHTSLASRATGILVILAPLFILGAWRRRVLRSSAAA